MALPIHLPDTVTFSVDPYMSDNGYYAYDDFRLIANRLKESKKVKCRVLSPVHVADDPGVPNASLSLISDNAWFFVGEARVEHSRKTGEEKWVKFNGWIGDSPGRLGSEEFYISPEDVDESWDDYLEDACKVENDNASIVITTSVTQSSSPVEMYD